MSRFLDRTGEKRIMRNGQEAEIIRYRSTSDIDVRFEDGYISEHKSYQKFHSGNIKNPNHVIRFKMSPEAVEKAVATKMEAKKAEREGERKRMNNGLMAELVRYGCERDCDILFEDGYLLQHARYRSFSDGIAYHPENRRAFYEKSRNLAAEKHLGEMGISRSGEAMRITIWRSCKDIDVVFEDGIERKHIQYANFVKGNVSKGKGIDRTGEKLLNTAGQEMEIIHYVDALDITVRFSDGAVREHVRYGNFKKGAVSHPSEMEKLPTWKLSIGTTVYATNGQRMEIIGGTGSHDVDVRFEDGTVVKHRRLHFALQGAVKNPNFDVQGGRVRTKEFCGWTNIRLAFRLEDGRVFYYAVSPDGETEICTPQDMLSHKK